MSGTGKTVPQLSEVVPVRAPATYLPLCAHPSVADEAVVQPSALPHNSPVLQKAGTALQLRVLPGQPSWLSDLMPDGVAAPSLPWDSQETPEANRHLQSSAHLGAVTATVCARIPERGRFSR